MGSSKETVVTLYESHYHYGVSALVNSLIVSQFAGVIRVGYRGSLPPWVNGLKKLSESNYIVNEKISLAFILIETKMHFAYYKPFFFQNLFLENPDIRSLYYFDPDITVHAPWSFFSAWPIGGIALCLDNCYPFISINHPWRIAWKKITGSKNTANIEYYVNSGFIGVKREDIEIINRWAEVTTIFQQCGGDIYKFNKEGHVAIKTDQDLLNAVIGISADLNFSIIGKEGMGFAHPAYLMSHAVDNIKPWKTNYLISLFRRGKRPSFAEKSYFYFANYPIRAYPYMDFMLKKINMKMAVALGRLIGN